MNSPLDLKQLEQLAKTCRKAGIKSFEGHGIKFTLSEDEPKSPYKKAKEVKKFEQFDPAKDIESDLPGGDAMLFWSSDGFDKETE